MCVKDNCFTSYILPKSIRKIGEISSDAFSPWECSKLFIPTMQHETSKELASVDTRAFINDCSYCNRKLTNQYTELSQDDLSCLLCHQNTGRSASGDGKTCVDEITPERRILLDYLHIRYIELRYVTVIASFTDCLKDIYEMTQFETVLQINPEEIAMEAEVKESAMEIEQLDTYNFIAGKDPSVETGYCWTTCRQPSLLAVVFSYSEYRSLSHTVYLNTKSMREGSDSLEECVQSTGQKWDCMLDTRENIPQKDVVFRQKITVSVTDYSMHCLYTLLVEDNIFVSNSNECYVTYKGNNQGKCRKVWKIIKLDIFLYGVSTGITATSVAHKTSQEFLGAIHPEASYSERKGMTTSSVLYSTMKYFLEAKNEHRQDGELIAICPSFLTSDIGQEFACHEMFPHSFSMQEYKGYRYMMCHIDDHNAPKKLLAISCESSRMDLEGFVTILSILEVIPKPPITEGQERVDLLNHSSKHKISERKNKNQTTQARCTSTDKSTRMFDQKVVFVPGLTFSAMKNDKCYEDTRQSRVYLDDKKLHLQDPNGSFSNGNREEIDLRRQKKHNLRQSIWLPLEELPPPQVHREVIVAFFSGEYSQTQRDAIPCTMGHEDFGEILKKLASDDLLSPYITMKYEILRLCTMRNYPKENKPFAVRLVAAGFYYAGNNTQLICYCCAIRIDTWVNGDIPISVHQKKSPDCSFLKNNGSVNIPIKRPTSAESQSVGRFGIQRSHGSHQSNGAQCDSSVMLPSNEGRRVNISNMHQHMSVTKKGSSLNHLNVLTGEQNVSDNGQTIAPHSDPVQDPPPKYLLYAVKNTRINSFQGWPAELKQKPEEMAECGFYYAGSGDCVRCFHCGVGLRHWTSEDDPWIEHARWSPSCIYVLKMKGEEFVTLVTMAVEIPESEVSKNSHCGGENNVNQNEREDITAVTRNEGKPIIG